MKKDAKRKAIKSLKDEMADMMGDRYSDGMKDKMSVKVISDSEEGIEEGLSKAQEIMKKRKAMMGEQDSPDISDSAKYGSKTSSNYKDFDDSDKLKQRIKMLESKMKKK